MAQSTYISIIFFNNNSHPNTNWKKKKLKSFISFFFLFSFPQYLSFFLLKVRFPLNWLWTFVCSVYWWMMLRRAWYFVEKYVSMKMWHLTMPILQKITRLPLSLSRKEKENAYINIYGYIVCIYKDACHSFCHELLLFLNHFFFHPDIKFYHLIAYMWEKQPEFMS